MDVVKRFSGCVREAAQLCKDEGAYDYYDYQFEVSTGSTHVALPVYMMCMLLLTCVFTAYIV